MDERRTRLLDAAVGVVAGEGTRALTHRAVDAAAGLPVGSTSNLFRTREALLAGVGERLLELDLEAWGAVGGGLPTSVDDMAQRLADFVVLSTTRYAHSARARMALLTERPAVLAPHHRMLLDSLTVLLGGDGDPGAANRAMLVIGLVDGLIVHAVSMRDGQTPPTSEIADAVRRLAGGE